MGKHSQSTKKPRSLLGKIFHVIMIGAFWCTILGICVAIFFFSYLMGLKEWKEFDPTKIGEMQQTLLIYDQNGEETAALFNKQNRVYITIDKIPEHVKNAFIAVEDARFYEHNGVDFIRTIGAFLEGITNGNSIRGTSSISQQLVKNTSLTGVRTISRKLQEAVMAFKLESEYDKDEILEMYLNYIYFGNGAYGIEAASKKYFDKQTSELTVAQAAQLAGIIKGPTHYAPHLNMGNSIKRRNLVLSLMHKQDMITKAEMEQAKSEIVVLSEEVDFEYGFFTDMVLDEAEEILSMDSEELLSSGYRIYTTLDQDMQESVEALFRDAENFPGNAEDGTLCQAALCVLDSQTSEIRAIIGGRNYETRRGINRAIDIRRQPGSTIKPIIVYAPAMEKLGYTPTTLVLDERGDFNGYVPKNYNDSYAGWVTLRKALTSSLNLPAVRVLEKLGVSTGKLYASTVGVPFDDMDVGLTLALGGFTTGVSPACLGNAFTPFANAGYYSQTACISKIEDGQGEVIYRRPNTRINVLSKETAFLMTSMLESAAEAGTARRLSIEGMELAAKTGTTGADNISGNKDIWTVAYNGEFTVSCWMGFDMTDEEHCLPKRVTGGTYPAKLIKKLLEEVYEDKQPPKFVQPHTIVEAKIDLKTVTSNSEPLLASAFTPDNQTTLEYFTEENVPTEYSSYWVVPSPPEDLTVTHGNGGYPNIFFTPKQEFALYRIMRTEVRNKTTKIIGEYKGDSGEIDVSDYSAEYGHSYRYYVVPVHPEILIKGQLLTGPPSRSERITVLSEDNYMP